jgi:predicted flap endonuclease-1-like 5' DNA nuclease
VELARAESEHAMAGIDVPHLESGSASDPTGVGQTRLAALIEALGSATTSDVATNVEGARPQAAGSTDHSPDAKRSRPSAVRPAPTSREREVGAPDRGSNVKPLRAPGAGPSHPSSAPAARVERADRDHVDESPATKSPDHSGAPPASQRPAPRPTLEVRATHDDADPARDPAFRSILPADLVQESVKATNGETGPRTAATAATVRSEHEIAEALVSIIEADDTTVDASADANSTVESVATASHESGVDGAVADDLAPDDLKEIRGIGPKIESILRGQGITSFQQIAELDDSMIEHLRHELGSFRGRIERDDWIGSARQLIDGRGDGIDS